jgi:membrane-bound lytic murein transglycosylase D
MIESGFGNFAYSRAKASGPWQFIGPTGKTFGLQQDFWVDERRDPERSAHAAARYLKKLREQTGDWRLAWAGYNAGVGRIFNAQKKGFTDFWEMAKAPGRGRKAILRDETKGYVPKLMAAAIITKHPEAFGFKAEEIEAQSWTDYAEVEVPHATLLTVLARASGVSDKEIIDLNPELRRACTPPRPYKLKIPKAQADTFAENWPAMQGKVRMTFAGHVIRRGDTLSSVATRYGVPVQGIVEMNGLKNGKRLRVGQELLIPKPVGTAAVAARAPEPARAAEPARRPEPATLAHTTERQVAAVERAPAAEKPSRTTLRIRSGDTLWSIAQKYGVDLAALCRWNGIKNPRSHKLLVGAQIVVLGERG